MSEPVTLKDVLDIDANLTVTGPGTFEIAEEDWNTVKELALECLAQRRSHDG